MSKLVFRSKVDIALPVAVFGTTLTALAVVWQRRAVEPSIALTVAAIVCVVVFGLFAWIFFGTAYEIGESELVIRSGPLRSAVPLASIKTVRFSNTVLAGPALSMRRLEIEHGKYDSAIVSPLDRDAFIAALLERNPDIRVERKTTAV